MSITKTKHGMVIAHEPFAGDLMILIRDHRNNVSYRSIMDYNQAIRFEAVLLDAAAGPFVHTEICPITISEFCELRNIKMSEIYSHCTPEERESDYNLLVDTCVDLMQPGNPPEARKEAAEILQRVLAHGP